MVGDLVHHRDAHLVLQLLHRLGHVEQRPAEEQDPVRQHAGVVGRALGERQPVVEAEQVGVVVRGLGLDQHHDVVDQAGQLVGQAVEGPFHHRVERGRVQVEGHGTHPRETSKQPQEPEMPIRASLVARPDRHAMATPTGLEPAASAVTGRRANQLRYGARL